MSIDEIKDLLEGTVLTDEDEESLSEEIRVVYVSDLMSEVLTHTMENAMLVTGLNNPQVIRTCHMMDIDCVVFVRGNIPSEAMINMAESMGICVISTQKKMFASCGLLYNAGMRGVPDGR